MTLVVGNDLDPSTTLNTVHIIQPKMPPHSKLRDNQPNARISSTKICKTSSIAVKVKERR